MSLDLSHSFCPSLSLCVSLCVSIFLSLALCVFLSLSIHASSPMSAPAPERASLAQPHLELRAESKKDAGLPVPLKHQASVSFHHQVDAHLVDIVGGLLPEALLDHLHLAIGQLQLIVLCNKGSSGTSQGHPPQVCPCPTVEPQGALPRLHPTHPQEDLDVLGAGGSCGTTGDVLGDNTKGILEAAVPITVVLEEQKAVRGQGRGGENLGLWMATGEAVRQAYLQQRVLAVPTEAVSLPIESDVVAIPVHSTGGQAGLVCAPPHPVLTGAT